MTLNRLATLTLLISSLSSVALVGCQSTELNHTNKIGAINPDINNEDWSISTSQSRLLQTITKYEWQLTHVTDENNQVQPFNHKPPLIMEVRPDVLSFKEGCHLYQASFSVWRPLPYPYSLPDMSDLPDDCKKTTNSNNSNLNKGDIQQALEIVFAPFSDSYFRFDPVLPESPLFSKNVSKQMALKTDKGRTFIFAGTVKPEQEFSGLPITNELLERYQWRLVSATDDTNKTISKFNHPDVPITARFVLDSYNQSVGFFSGCNGIGGSYALSINQTLLIGASPSTLMGCGDLHDDIESHLSRIMLNSTSQLILTNQDKTQISDVSIKPEPSYSLTQKLDSSETLVWQNQPIPEPKPNSNTESISNVEDAS